MAINKYDNLDFLLNIYHDYVYDTTHENTYIFKHINPKLIKLIDLQKPVNFNYDAILDATFKYIGYYNNQIHFKRKTNKGRQCHISFGCYDELTSKNMNKGVLYNIGMMYIISEIVIKDNFTHSILPIMLFNVDDAKVNNVIPNFTDLLLEHKIKCKEKSYTYCLITEHFYSSMYLRDYLKLHSNMNEQLWANLLFQVLYSLYKLSEKLTNFQHNHLDLDSIRVYIKNVTDYKTVYKISDTQFNIPNCGFEIRICDYTYATTDDYIQNVNALKKPYNEFHDIHYFFMYLRLWIQENNISVPQNIQNFINNCTDSTYNNTLTTNTYKGFDNQQTDSININYISSSIILKKNTLFNTFKQIGEMSATPYKKTSLLFPTRNETSITDTDNVRLLGQIKNSDKIKTKLYNIMDDGPVKSNKQTYELDKIFKKIHKTVNSKNADKIKETNITKNSTNVFEELSSVSVSSATPNITYKTKKPDKISETSITQETTENANMSATSETEMNVKPEKKTKDTNLNQPTPSMETAVKSKKKKTKKVSDSSDSSISSMESAVKSKKKKTKKDVYDSSDSSMSSMETAVKSKKKKTKKEVSDSSDSSMSPMETAVKSKKKKTKKVSDNSENSITSITSETATKKKSKKKVTKKVSDSSDISITSDTSVTAMRYKPKKTKLTEYIEKLPATYRGEVPIGVINDTPNYDTLQQQPNQFAKYLNMNKPHMGQSMSSPPVDFSALQQMQQMQQMPPMEYGQPSGPMPQMQMPQMQMQMPQMQMQMPQMQMQMPQMQMPQMQMPMPQMPQMPMPQMPQMPMPQMQADGEPQNYMQPQMGGKIKKYKLVDAIKSSKSKDFFF